MNPSTSDKLVTLFIFHLTTSYCLIVMKGKSWISLVCGHLEPIKHLMSIIWGSFLIVKPQHQDKFWLSTFFSYTSSSDQQCLNVPLVLYYCFVSVYVFIFIFFSKQVVTVVPGGFGLLHQDSSVSKIDCKFRQL